jgi:hypothetical protein
MGFVIQMVPAGVLETPDNAARDHLGAETADTDPRIMA